MPETFKEIKTADKILTYKYLVDGEWQESRNRKLTNIFSPIDSSLLGRIQSVLPKEADIAVVGASMAQELWAQTPLKERVAVLKKAAGLLSQNKRQLTDLLVIEIGKIKKDAEKEVEHALEVIEDCLKEGVEEKTKIKIAEETCQISKMSVGVVLCITPFNYPIYTTISKIVTALIAGNSVVVKPSTAGSISTLHFCHLFQKAGLPAGVLNVITGAGPQIGRYLARHRLINQISFTGSTRVGREIIQKSNIVSYVFELGGKDPAIVLEDADINRAAKEIVFGTFAYAGQRCMAIKRVIVHRKIKEKLLKKMKEIIKKEFMPVGDPRDLKTNMGPVISDRQADYLARLIRDATKKGAKIIFGGRRFSVAPKKVRLRRRILELPRRLIRLRRGQGRYFEPTILDNVKPSMKIAWEEQFGPILPIIAVKNEKEAVNIANASEYGLDASVFTKDNKKAQAITEKLEVGQVFINCRPHRAPDRFPFTGLKSSGLGTQGIKYSIESTQRIKSVRE